jgi:hypothetical protein
VNLTHYSIRSSYDGRVSHENLKSWAIEGSLDGNTWIELDRKEPNDQLNDENLVRTFALAHHKEVQIVRLRQTGKNHGGYDTLLLSAFEVFGSLMVRG